MGGDEMNHYNTKTCVTEMHLENCGTIYGGRFFFRNIRHFWTVDDDETGPQLIGPIGKAWSWSMRPNGPYGDALFFHCNSMHARGETGNVNSFQKQKTVR